MGIFSRLKDTSSAADKEFEESLHNAIDLRDSPIIEEPTVPQLHIPVLNILTDAHDAAKGYVAYLKELIDSMNADIITIQTEKDSMIAERCECIRQAEIVLAKYDDNLKVFHIESLPETLGSTTLQLSDQVPEANPETKLESEISVPQTADVSMPTTKVHMEPKKAKAAKEAKPGYDEAQLAT